MEQEQWSSTMAVLFAPVGAPAGLGNIWRFSAVVGQDGGGAFRMPYFTVAFAFGVPLMILEMFGNCLDVSVKTSGIGSGRRRATNEELTTFHHGWET